MFSSVGETIVVTVDSTVDYTQLVGQWYNEGTSYNYVDNSCSDITCASYTQVNS